MWRTAGHRPDIISSCLQTDFQVRLATGREPIVVLDTVPSYQRGDNYRDVGRIPLYSQSAVGRRMSQIQIKKKRGEEKKKEKRDVYASVGCKLPVVGSVKIDTFDPVTFILWR